MLSKIKLNADFFAFFAMCSLAISIPLLGTLGEGATFFIEHDAKASDILLFAFGVYILPPIVLIGITHGIKSVTNPSAANLFVSIALGLLAALWAMSLALRAPTAGTIAVGLVFGVLVTWGYLSNPRVQSLVKIVGQISPIILIYFLVFTPVNKLILPEHVVLNDATGGAKTPVLMLVFDELSLAGLVTPEGKIDEGRLPNFARLQRMSTWYSEATTVSTSTHTAILAILTGTLPNDESLPVYSEYPHNLFTLLAGSHDIYAKESVSRLCPESECNKSGKSAQTRFTPGTLYEDAWYVWLHSVLPVEISQRYLPPIAHGWRDFGREDSVYSKRADDTQYKMFLRAIIKYGVEPREIPDLANIVDTSYKDFIASLRRRTGASLSYLHLLLPHHPWIRFPDGSVYNGSSPPGLIYPSLTWREDLSLADQGVLQYALQVEYADKLLGGVLDVLEESGRLNETLLIVVADHGLAIAPGESLRKPGAATSADLLRVPLFIKYPGKSEKKEDLRKVQTVDILPTIADVLNLELTSGVDGQSLVSEDWQPVKRKVVGVGEDIPDVEAVINMKSASERIYRVLEPGRSALESFGTVNSRSFMGTSTPQTIPSENNLTITLDQPDSYTNLDLGSGVFPARLSGTVEGADLGTEILIALNNTFAGSSVTYDDRGSISIMLDPRRFRDGSNVLSAYTLHAGDLRKLEISSTK